MRLGDNFKGHTDIYCLFQAVGVLIDKLCGVALDLCRGKAQIKRQDIADLFWNIYCSKEIVNVLFPKRQPKAQNTKGSSSTRFLVKPKVDYKNIYVYSFGDTHTFSENFIYADWARSKIKCADEDPIKHFVDLITGQTISGGYENLIINDAIDIDLLYKAMDQFLPISLVQTHENVLIQLIRMGLVSITLKNTSKKSREECKKKMELFICSEGDDCSEDNKS